MKEVPLHGQRADGRVALVDDEDYELVSQYRWFIHEVVRPGNQRPGGPYAMAYVRRGKTKTTIRMHKLLTGWPETDHRNHDGLDNRRENLRPANKRNQQNARPHLNGTSRYKGVSWYSRSSRWKAQIRANGVKRHLGYFSSEEDAARAYDDAAAAAFGEYAVLNLVDKSVT